MKNKGWLRIVESVIGVMIILLALIYFVSQQSEKMEKSEKAYEVVKVLLDEIENNVTLRDYVKNSQKPNLDTALRNFLQDHYSLFDVSSCIKLPDELCLPGDINLPEDREVFSGSRLISYVSNGKVEAKKVIVYVWRK